MKKPILVVLAAGMGSRYGGLKQMDAIGHGGEVLLDYSVFDAARSGFGKAVFIIRRDFADDFKSLVLSRMEKHIDCALAYQELDSIVPPASLKKAKDAGRTKPWGTTHALLCAESVVDAPFAVINADDFYGRESFAALGGFLPTANGLGAIVPYRLEYTLSPQGTVTRGVCEIEDGILKSVDELLLIEKKDGAIFNTNPDGTRRDLAASTPVSMNCWGFPETIFPALREYFDNFLAENADKPKAECYLPMAADWFTKTGRLEIKALEANAEWFGVTYKEDRALAVKRIENLVAKGVYPERLWK